MHGCAGGLSQATCVTALTMSVLTVALVGFAGWLGGHLVFAHQIGIDNE